MSDTKSGRRRLLHKQILITGAGDDIASCVAHRFHDEGADVTAIDRDLDSQAFRHGIQSHALDLADETQLKAFANDLTQLHSIFIGTAHNDFGTLIATEQDQWQSTFNRIVHDTFRVIQACLPTLIFSGGGTITIMSSIAGHVLGIENRCAYSAAKAALVGLTKSIAADYGSHGIRCNAICSGIFDTAGVHAQLASTGDFDSARDAAVGRHAMGRLGTVEELAHLAVYLAGDESGFTTGQAFVIDGGYSDLR